MQWTRFADAKHAAEKALGGAPKIWTSVTGEFYYQDSTGKWWLLQPYDRAGYIGRIADRCEPGDYAVGVALSGGLVDACYYIEIRIAMRAEAERERAEAEQADK